MILFHDFSVWYLTDDINKSYNLIFWTELKKAGSNQQVSALQYLILNHYEPLREDKNAGGSREFLCVGRKKHLPKSKNLVLRWSTG